MSTKHSKAAALKRQRREQRSKAKRKTANRSHNLSPRRSYQFNENSDLLQRAMKAAGEKGHGELQFNDSNELITGIKKAAGEVFKLYSYITLANALIEKGAITHSLSIDLVQISKNLMALDARVGRLGVMDEVDLNIEVLGIATDLNDYSDQLYTEVTKLEPHSLVIESALQTLSKEVEETSEDPAGDVLKAMAYRYLTGVKLSETKEVDWTDIKEVPEKFEPAVAEHNPA